MNRMNDSNSGGRTFADMINEQAGSRSASSGGNRRLSMAEMLRQSPLMGNTVALPDAVESAQVAKARKEEPQQAESNAPTETSVASAPQAAPAVSASRVFPFAELVPAVECEPRSSAKRYNLYARVEGKWIWQCDIHAPTHAEGMRQAIAWLKPEHDALPIRLEQDEVSAG
jgi:hypothetical protein